MNIPAIVNTLEYEEGLGLACYLCPADKLTIAFGHNIEANTPDSVTLLRWLMDGITRQEAQALLIADVQHAIDDCQRWPWWPHLLPCVQSALVLMVYQMGHGSVSGFDNMINALAQGDGCAASVHALDSKWARTDSPERATRTAHLMRTGEFPRFMGLPAEVDGVRLRDALKRT